MAFNLLVFVAVIVLSTTITSCTPYLDGHTSTSDSRYDTYEMWHKCQLSPSSYYSTTSISEDKGVLLYSYNISDHSSASSSCSIVFEADSRNSRLYVKAEKLSLGSSDVCIKLWDQKFDNSMYWNTSDHKHCGSAPFDLSMTTSQQYLTVMISTSDRSYDYKDTTFRLVITHLKADCPPPAQCDNGDCLWPFLRNDGHQNCPDNSDEKGVTSAPCMNNLPSCNASGKCIAASSKCDWLADCPDGSDEFNCVYKCVTGYSGNYQCPNEDRCYSDYDRCNDHFTCSDGSDNKNCDSCEENSYYHHGSSNRRYCAETRTCLIDDQFCNGVVDCPSGMDEDYDACHPSIYWYWTPGQLAGLFIGYVVFAVFVVGIAALVHKKCQPKRVE